jgi:hypothetical protein
MEEFIRSYGIWILLAAVFFGMHWFGMGCGGSHRHREDGEEKPGDGGKRSPTRSSHSRGCH